MKIVVTGLIASYPLGGVGWDYMAYVAGFARLGCEVFYLEDTGNWFYDPGAETFTQDVSGNLHYLVEAFASAGVEIGARWSVRSPDGNYHGASRALVERFCGHADLFLNVSGACWLRQEYRGARCIAYLDTDPCYTQAKLLAAQHGTASADVAYSVALIRAHDTFFTFAENIAHPSCRVPTCELRWVPTRQPIVLEHWPVCFAPEAEAFTTVMSWKTDTTLPSIGGLTYAGKDVEFRRFIELPRRVPLALEVALAGAAPVDELRSRGWRVVEPLSQAGTMLQYRDYLARSRGEWSVAKNAYVASRSGWFSCRSAAYLASGKPVVAQDTGFSAYYPTGAGLFTFTTMEEAVGGLQAANSDYRRQCDAARALAEREFASDKVLSRLLRDAGLERL